MTVTYRLVDGKPTIDKAPAEVLDYSEDWSDYLALVPGDTIATSTWAVTAGITKGTTTNTASAAIVWLSGGALGALESATNTIVTAQGRTAVRTIYLSIVPR